MLCDLSLPDDSFWKCSYASLSSILDAKIIWFCWLSFVTLRSRNLTLLLLTILAFSLAETLLSSMMGNGRITLFAVLLKLMSWHYLTSCPGSFLLMSYAKNSGPGSKASCWNSPMMKRFSFVSVRMMITPLTGFFCYRSSLLLGFCSNGADFGLFRSLLPGCWSTVLSNGKYLPLNRCSISSCQCPKVMRTCFGSQSMLSSYFETFSRNAVHTLKLTPKFPKVSLWTFCWLDLPLIGDEKVITV